MADGNHAAVSFHRAMLRVLARVHDLERAFEAWGAAARELDASNMAADDAAQHAAIDESRDAFARIVERFPAAAQMIGVDRLAMLVHGSIDSLGLPS